MANERIEAEFEVPAGTQVSVTTVAQSATTVTATAGDAFMSDFLSGFQTALNNASQGYPQSAAATNSAVQFGTWSAGWLFNITSGNDAGAFGGVTMTAVSSPTYGTAGPRAGIDLAVGFNSSLDAFSAGDNFDVDATSDLLIAWVGKFTGTPGAARDLFSKYNAANPRWIVYHTGSDFVFNLNDGVDNVDAGVAGLAVGEWHVGIAVLDRGAGVARIGTRTLAGVTTVGSTASTAAIGTLESTDSFLVGNAVQGAPTDFLLAGLYVGTGTGAATGLSAGLSTALTNFANAINAAWAVSMSSSTGLVSIGWTGYTTPTWSLSWTSTALRDLLGFTANISSVTTTQTGTGMPSGVWLPGCPYAADSDPKQAPTGDDKTHSISPTGRSYALTSSTYFRHRNVRFSHVAQHLTWANSALVVGADWETFYLETQLGQHSWFEAGSRVIVYWDNAGTLTELGSGDVEAWTMPQCTKLDDLTLASAPWTGLVEIKLGDLYADQ